MASFRLFFLFFFFLLFYLQPSRSHESIGGICQFKDDTGSDVGCFESWNLRIPVLARYAMFVIVTTGLCIIGYIICHIKSGGQVAGAEISRSTNTPRLENVVVKGLDSPTIEMYPTTLVGESLQLPKPTDNICPICLLDYKANDILRTIPSCMHYFHVDCIDEWLKRNATCPLCRN